MIRNRLLFIFFVGFISINLSFATQNSQRLKQSIRDEAIQVPASLTANIDSLLSAWVITNHLAVDENCIQNSVNPDIPDSVYIERLSKLPSIIEMPYNQVVRSYINFYAERLRDRVSYMLGLTHFYFPLFEQALEAENMPLELKYLPVIESALNPAATSRVGAAGLWQFMIYTGREYGLEVNNLVDERRDPIKSTYVAVRYLKALYGIYGDWNLAIAAYNCGPGNVNKAIRRSGGKRDYWEIYFNLPKETRGYVPAFIAVNYLMTYAKEHNICSAECKLPLNSDTVQVTQMMHFQQIADILNIPIDEIRILNPQYRRDLIPGNRKPCTLRLPMVSAYAFVDFQDTIANYHADQLLLNFRKTVDPGISDGNYVQTRIRHKVRSNETMGAIARKYDVSVTDIKKWNHLRSTRVRRGTSLVIYYTKRVAPAVEPEKESLTAQNSSDELSESTTTEKKVTANKLYHKVRKGETIAQVARKYRVTVSDLKSWNKLKTSVLKTGTLLAVKTSDDDDNAAADDSSEEITAEVTPLHKVKASEQKMTTKIVPVVLNHKVRRGESLSLVAKKYGVQVSDLKKWNKLRSNRLDLGDVLAIRTTKTVKVPVEPVQNLVQAKKKVDETSGHANDSLSISAELKEPAGHKNTKSVSVNIPVRDFEFYKVRKGDTLWAIANRYPGVSVDQILQANQMSRHDAIQVGMRIKIPKS